MQPSPACTQQRWVLMIWRHWPLQQGDPPPGMQTAPRGVQELQNPPMQLRPEQQSLFPSQRAPRLWHTQRPPVHDIAPQQSAPEVHAPIAATHAQRPPVHCAPLQQSLLPVHAPPAGLQQLPLDGFVGEPVHVSDPQQLGPPERHDPPDITQVEPIIWQVPPWQTSGDMQSLLPVHPPPIVCRVQRPPLQLSSPQQSVSRAQLPPSARQQRSVPCELLHMVPVAQPGVPPGVHVEPAGSGVEPEAQVEPAQVRPMQQSPEPEHADPLAPQERHSPPTQVSAEFEQRFMSQQRWPSPPQTVVLARHTFDMQVKPASHALRPQQGSPSPPQDIIPEPGRQVPLLHVSPELHAEVPQHDCPSAPHAVIPPPPASVPVPPPDAA